MKSFLKIWGIFLVGGLWLGGARAANDCGQFPGGFAWSPSQPLVARESFLDNFSEVFVDFTVVELEAWSGQVAQAIENLGNHCCRKTARGKNNPQICENLEKKLVGKNADNVPASPFLVDQIFDVTMRFWGGVTGENYGLAPDPDAVAREKLVADLLDADGTGLDVAQEEIRELRGEDGKLREKYLKSCVAISQFLRRNFSETPGWKKFGDDFGVRCERFVAEEISQNFGRAQVVLPRGTRQNLQAQIGKNLVSEERTTNRANFQDLLSKIGVTRESLAKSLTITKQCQL